MIATILYGAGMLGAIALDACSRQRMSAAIIAGALSLITLYAGILQLPGLP